MDYQFYYDVSGMPRAECEITAFGDWLSYDLANQSAQIEQLLTVIQQLSQRQIKSSTFEGREYCLNLNQDEVELSTHFVAYSDDTETLPEGTEIDETTDSGCGLEDLHGLLLAWQKFVTQGYT